MPGNLQEGVLPLMQRLAFFRGLGSNIFENGDIAYIPYFWSCSTNYDVAHAYNDGYIYILLLEPGEHCPFINMGNLLKGNYITTRDFTTKTSYFSGFQI